MEVVGAGTVCLMKFFKLMFLYLFSFLCLSRFFRI